MKDTAGESKKRGRTRKSVRKSSPEKPAASKRSAKTSAKKTAARKRTTARRRSQTSPSARSKSPARRSLRRRPGEPAVARTLDVSPVGRVTEEAKSLDRGAYRETEYVLPESYGIDRSVLMARDPYWVHAYWEITDGTMNRGLQRLGEESKDARMTLRVYTTGGRGSRPNTALFDIALTSAARNWYINVGGPGREYRVEIGLLTRRGEFVCLVQSNSVSTPSDRMSDVLDEKWTSVAPPYEEMYALSGGLTLGVSSPELHERLARRLEQQLASPLFSPGGRDVQRGAEPVRRFWMRVDADVVVYGATEPGASLLVKGGSCRLREDGTFSFRCHFPDGTKEVSISARSADGTQAERVRLAFDRSTDKGAGSE
ncbi:MAG: DUF4912 domain-containing protein [Candidatus Eisenbacteria bacterium]